MTLFLLEAVVVSLSGVMAPGPITAATLAAGTRRRHAGALVAVGHGLIEFPLMALLIAGLATVLNSAPFRIGIGLVGGAALVLMAAGTFVSLAQTTSAAHPAKEANPLWTGVLLTGTNPYFLLWWATVGLALLTHASSFGILAVLLFAAVHWVCDLVWLEVLSLASFKGASTFGPAVQRTVLVICATAMVAFGLIFIHHAFRDWMSG